MENQGNTIPPEEHNNFPVTYPKEMEIYKLLEKEFQIIIIRNAVRFKGTQIENPTNSRT